MAREVQRGRPSRLGRADVRERTYTPARQAGAYLSWGLGQCTIPVPLPASSRDPSVTSPGARMVPRRCHSCCALRLGFVLEAPVLCPVAVRAGSSCLRLPSSTERRPNLLHECALLSSHSAAVTMPDRISAPAAAVGTSVRSPALRSHALATRCASVLAAQTSDVCRLERAMAGSHRATSMSRNCNAYMWGSGRPWGRI